VNADDLRVRVFDGDGNIGPPFLEAHVRSPHVIDLVDDDGFVVRLLLVAPDAMGREQAVPSPHPAHAARARANPGNAQSRPYFATAFAMKVGRFDVAADRIGQVSIRTTAGQTAATGEPILAIVALAFLQG
jgi:hypothetical protein